ncbi:MAG: hypothetical protein KDC54_12105 [Lewinella sp.]|nr:hypothetical protein [Lewinella sp.]
MSDTPKQDQGAISDAMREAARQCARAIKEHDFAVMGYEASVVDIYAQAFHWRRIGPGEEISQDDARALISKEFTALYGQSPEEARSAQTPGLYISAFRDERPMERSPSVTRNKTRSHSKERGPEGHDR